MIDWDAAVIGPTNSVFGEPILYWPSIVSAIYSAGVALPINGVFDEGYTPVTLVEDPAVSSTHPVLGVQLSQLPAAFDPINAQEDRFTVVRTGLTYIVKAGKPDGHGWARLDANLAPS